MVSKIKFNIVKEKKDCISAIRALFVTSKLFGCNLFYLPKDRYSTEPIKMKAIDYVSALVYTVLYFVFTFPLFIDMVFVKTSTLLSSGNFIIIALVRIIFYFIIIANFSCYIMDTLNRNKIWRLLTMLYDFDDEVCYFGFCLIKIFIIFFSGKEFRNQNTN